MMRIFPVIPCLVREDGEEAEGLEAGGLLARAPIAAGGFPQRESGMIGSENVLPKMREGLGAYRSKFPMRR